MAGAYPLSYRLRGKESVTAHHKDWTLILGCYTFQLLTTYADRSPGPLSLRRLKVTCTALVIVTQSFGNRKREGLRFSSHGDIPLWSLLFDPLVWLSLIGEWRGLL